MYFLDFVLVFLICKVYVDSAAFFLFGIFVFQFVKFIGKVLLSFLNFTYSFRSCANISFAYLVADPILD